jgi:hypothetical protein
MQRFGCICLQVEDAAPRTNGVTYTHARSNPHGEGRMQWCERFELRISEKVVKRSCNPCVIHASQL